MDEKERARALTLHSPDREAVCKGSILRLGRRTDRTGLGDFDGFDFADSALGVGGVPRGRICEIFGPESSGRPPSRCRSSPKRRRRRHRGFHRRRARARPAYAKKPAWMWTTAGIAAGLGRAGAGDHVAPGQLRADDVLVVDSVAALVPNRARGRDGRQPHGRAARLMSQALRKLTGSVSKSRTCCVHQPDREKIG